MTQPSKRRRWLIGASAFVALALGTAALFAYLRLSVRDPFERDPSGLPAAARTEIVELADGATFDLRAEMVQKSIGDATVKMFAYNGSVPGPTLKVAQGAEVTVRVTNQTELDTTVHWHGIRLENQFDGAPHETQAPIPVGSSFDYRLRFPDPGIYWYHPHIREDYAQELGLYGNIIVLPEDAGYWGPANREETLVLDDILLENGQIAAFSQSTPNHTAMGRYGKRTSFPGAAHNGQWARCGSEEAGTAAGWQQDVSWLSG